MNTRLHNYRASSDDDEAEQLIMLLYSWGVRYLMSATDEASLEEDVSAVELIRRLAQCTYPRVRDASTGLFLLHPELAPAILEACNSSPADTAEQIVTLTLAALYLQYMWSFRLTIALGHAPTLPEAPFEQWWQERQLPAPACHFGKMGLYALELREQQRHGFAFNLIDDWQNQLNHLSWQEEKQHHPLNMSELAQVWQNMSKHEEEQEYCGMSMRPEATKLEIEKFLQTLGRTFRKAGRLYLVGGAALVHLGIRGGSTLDIDIAIEASDEDGMMTAIQRIKEQLHINVEFASPGDFIPLPSQWATHARYIGRYGSIDVFYFDFYSIALSKIARYSRRDLLDVQRLYEQGTIELDELDAAYAEILPHVGKSPYTKLNRQRFAENYASVRQQLTSA